MALTKITSDVIGTGAVTSDHLASGAVTHSSLSSITTDNVSEGSTNTYFTNARARGSISVTGGNLSYDSGTGVIQLTTDQIRTAVSGGTGVSISAGEISIGQDVATSSTPTFGNITTTGYIAGPATFTIDPAAVGDNTGTVVIAGNLQVDGTTTTINSTTMTVDDLNITLASGAANAAAANGAGITVDGASATITYDGTNDAWSFNKNVGIGITAPDSALHVHGVGAVLSSDSYFVAQIQTDRNDDGSNDDGILQFVNGSSKTVKGEIRFDESTNTFELGHGDNQNHLVIASGGNVGIGNSTPSNNHANANRLVVGNGTAGGIANYVGTGLGWYAFSRDNANNTDAYDGGMSYDGSRNLMFHTNAGSERMRIDGVGRVMIGTSSNSGVSNNADNLIVGDNTSATEQGITLCSTLASGIRWNDGADAGLIEYVHSDNRMVFHTAGLERMRIDGTGNVGIGTTTLFSKLSINSNGAPATSAGNMASTGLTVHNGTGGTAVQLGTYDAGSWSYIQSGYVNNATVAREFRIMNGANYTMTLSNTGKVGIGETNPLNELHVNGNVHIGDGEDYSSYAKLAVYGNVYQGDVALLIKNDRYNDSTATASLIFEHRTHAGQGHAAKIVCRRQSGYNESAGSKDAALDFYTAEGGTLTRHMVLNRSGQFGVGNNDTFDAYAEHVIQADNNQKVLDIKQNNSTGRVLGLQYIPNGPDDTTDYYMVCSDSNTNDMFVFSNGNVANKNNSYGSSSDIKIKQNITDANSQWNDIKALQFKNYKLKTDVARYGEDNADTLLGLIAQDVETAGMNGLVYESKDEDSEGNKLDTVTKGVKYSVLYLKAVKALQEAIVKIEDLESRLDEAGL